VILSSLSGTVVARDESLPVWADVEAAMELDLLGVAVRVASKERNSTIKRFQPREVTSWGDGASCCWVIVWVSARDAARARGPMHGLDLSPHDEVLLRGPGA
jgi:hypothetical protein